MKKILLPFFAAASMGVSAQTWTQQNSGFAIASTGINAIRIVDANTVWALGYDGSATEANYQTFTKTTNGGTTWTPGGINVGNTAYLISDLTAVSATTAWATATSVNGGPGGGVWKTTDGGATWAKQTTAAYNSTGSFANVVHFWDANNGVTMGDPTNNLMEIYVTSNGGTNWTELTSAVVPATQSGEYGYVHNRAVAGDNIWAGTNKGRIFKSANKGLSWTVVSTPLSDFGGAASSGTIALKDANTAWILDNNGVVRGTTNGGTTWSTLATIAQSNGIAYVPGTVSTLLAVGNGDGSNISYNGGTTWTPIETTNAYVSVAALNPTTVFGGGFNTSSTVGGIYKLGGILAVNDVKANDGQISVYPNPTSDILNIRSKDKVKQVSVYDLSGKRFEIKLDRNSADVSALQSGVYMIVVETDGGKIAEKFIKK